MTEADPAAGLATQGIAPPVAGLILAGGRSTRMGRAKQTLPLGDTTVLGWVLRQALGSNLTQVVLALHQDVQAPPEALAPRVTVEPVCPTGQGCTRSVQAALAQIAPGCAAVAILLGDMPEVDSRLIDALIAGWAVTRPWGALTDYRNGPGHPVLFAQSAFDELRAMHGDKAIWKLLDAHQGQVQRLHRKGDKPADIDTWEDYLGVCSRLGTRPAVSWRR